MSTCYWMCEGIGIRTNRLYEHLNRDKCIEVLRRELGADFDEDFCENNEFDIDEYLYGNPFENLGDLLCHCDDTNTMTYGDNGDGEYYFYYTPSYPWNRKENEPLSIVEVHERIIDAVQCISDLSRKQIEDMIDDDIYDYGCG